VRVLAVGRDTIRAVTNLMVSSADIAVALGSFARILTASQGMKMAALVSL
jgi:hypothetical protein